MDPLEIKIKDLFGIDYENEATIVFNIIKKNIYIIIGCGSLPLDFAKYCKKKIDEHYKNFPGKNFTDLTFKQENQGNDNWEIKPMFHYDE